MEGFNVKMYTIVIWLCVTFTITDVILFIVWVMWQLHCPWSSPGGRGNRDIKKDGVGMFVDDLVHLR